jgi:DNA-binding XRE family transcriptional regulator
MILAVRHWCNYHGTVLQNPDATAGVHSAIVALVPVLTNLRDLRVRAALSQADLAKRAGVARTTIIRLEQGDPNVLPSTLRKLARALRVRPATLIGE